MERSSRKPAEGAAPRARRAWLGFGLCLLLAGLGLWFATRPLLLHPGELLPSPPPPVSAVESPVHAGVWNLWRVSDSLERGLHPLFSDGRFAPHGVLFGDAEHGLLHGAVGAPFVRGFGAPAAYVGLLLGFVLASALAAFSLGRELGLRVPLALTLALLYACQPAFLWGAARGLDVSAVPWPALVGLGAVRRLRSARPLQAPPLQGRSARGGAALWIGIGLAGAAWTGWASLAAALCVLPGVALALAVRPETRSRLSGQLGFAAGVLALFALAALPLLQLLRGAEAATRFTLEPARGSVQRELFAAERGRAAEVLSSSATSGAALPFNSPAQPLEGLGQLVGALFDPGRPACWLIALMLPLALTVPRARAALAGALCVALVAALPWPDWARALVLERDLAPAVYLGLAVAAVLALERLYAAAGRARAAGSRAPGSGSAVAGHRAPAWAAALVLALPLLLAVEPTLAPRALLRLERPAALAALAAEPGTGLLLELPGTEGSSASLSWATLHGKRLVLPHAGRGRTTALEELARRAPALLSMSFGGPLPDPLAVEVELRLLGVDHLVLTPGWTPRAAELEHLLDELAGFERMPLEDARIHWWRRLAAMDPAAPGPG